MKGLIFTYLLTYGGAAAALVRPWYGLLIYVCFAIIKPDSLWSYSVPVGNYSRVVALALLAGWAISGFGNWRLGRSKAVVFSLIGFWVWSLLSATLVASDKDVAFAFVESMAKIVLPFLAGITLLDSERKLKQLAWVIVGSQGFLAYEMNVSFFNGLNPLQTPWDTGGFAGMDNNCVAIAMVTGVGLAFFLGMHESGWRKWVAFIFSGLMAHTVLFSFSRGGMVGLIILGVVAFLLIDKRPQHFLLFGLGVFAALALAGPEVREEFMTVFVDEAERDYSAQSRVDMWKNCIQVMSDHPLLGVGPDHWTLIAASYGWPEGKEAHTLWLQIGAELGFVGLGFLLAFYLITAGRLWRFARRRVSRASEWDIAVARMTIAAFAGFIVSAQFVSLEGLELPYYVTILGAGTLKLNAGRNLAWSLAEAPPAGYALPPSHPAAVSAWTTR